MIRYLHVDAELELPDGADEVDALALINIAILRALGGLVRNRDDRLVTTELIDPDRREGTHGD